MIARLVTRAVLGFIAALALAAGCASSGGGSNTNWVCEADRDCAAGETCVERRCVVREASTLAPIGRDGSTDAEPVPECGAAPDVRVHACPSPTGFAGDGSVDGGGPFEITGTVTELTPGAYGCTEDREYDPTGFTFRVVDGTQSLAVGVTVPWAPMFAVGQRVSVRSSYVYNRKEAPSEGSTTVRGEAGELLLWVAESGSAETLLAPDEFDVQAGAPACGASTSCGNWERRTFRVLGDGNEATLDPGETRELGAYSLVGAAFDVQTSSTAECGSYWLGYVVIAAASGGPAELSKPSGCGTAGPCSATEYCSHGTSDCFSPATPRTCAARPADGDCTDDCPGVCGCDGRFYCNQCLARQAGVEQAEGYNVRTFGSAYTGCKPPECMNGGSRAIDGTSCNYTWECEEEGYPSDYGIECTSSGGEANCACSFGGAVTRSVRLPALPPTPQDCGSRALVFACGFPPSIAPP